MKVTVTQENLNKALGVVSRVASSKTSLPVLNNILLRTETTDSYSQQPTSKLPSLNTSAQRSRAKAPSLSLPVYSVSLSPTCQKEMSN